ncbi:MAG: type II CAAX prenyl endopeptidase Rce1 family protein [Terracidiphilus sp.]
MNSPCQTEFCAGIAVNGLAQIQQRAEAGRIPWMGPLLLVSARSVLWLSLQCMLALILFFGRHPAPFRTAGNWWPVYCNLGDAGCLLGMRYFTRREGIRLRDLIGPIRMRRGHDLFLALGILVLAYPLFILGGHLAGVLLYGSMARVPMEFLMHRHALPLWATVYSMTVWWIIQSATEEMTYMGYVLPRLQALSGRTWIAMLIVGFWAALQHCMFPFVLDWRYLAFHFLIFIPFILVWMAIYLRIRRLPPLILAHWPMDFAVSIMTAMR